MPTPNDLLLGAVQLVFLVGLLWRLGRWLQQKLRQYRRAHGTDQSGVEVVSAHYTCTTAGDDPRILEGIPRD